MPGSRGINHADSSTEPWGDHSLSQRIISIGLSEARIAADLAQSAGQAMPAMMGADPGLSVRAAAR